MTIDLPQMVKCLFWHQLKIRTLATSIRRNEGSNKTDNQVIGEEHWMTDIIEVFLWIFRFYKFVVISELLKRKRKLIDCIQKGLKSLELCS